LDWNVFSGKNLDVAVAGPAELRADLAGTLEAPEAAVSLIAPRMAIGGLQDVAFRLSAAYSPQSVRVSELETAWHGQSIRGQGAVGLSGESPSLDLHLRLRNASLESILAGANRSDIPIRGALEGEATIGGTVAKPQGAARLSATSLQAYGEPFGKLSVRARADGGTARLEQLRLDKAPGQTLEASGVYDLSTRRMTFTANGRNLVLRQLTPVGGKPVQATIDLTAAGSGTIDDPEARSQLKIRNARYGDDSLGSIDVQLGAANRQVTAGLDSPDFRIHAEGTTGIDSPYPARFEIQARGTEIEKLPLYLKEPLKGTLQGIVRGSGNLADWQNGMASAEFETVSLDVRGQKVHNDGPLQFSYQNGTLQATHAVLVSSQSRLELAGAFPSQLQVKGSVDLATVSAFIPEQKVKASGQLTLDGDLLGTWKKLDAAMRFRVTDANIEIAGMPPVSHLSLQGQIRNGTVTEELSGHWASGQITSSGEVPLGLFHLPDEVVRKEGPANLSLQVKGVDLASLPGVPSTLGGAVSLRLDAEAPKADFDSLTAHLQIDELQLRSGDVRVQQSGISSIRIQHRTARIEQFAITGSGTDIRISGTAGLSGTQPLDLKAEGSFNAAIVAALAEGFKMQGPSRLQLAVSGTMDKPLMNGFVETDNATLAIPSPQLAVDNLKARVDVQGTLIRLTSLTGALNGGTLTAGGRVRYQPGFLNDINLGLKADNVYLDFPQGLKTISNVDVNLHGTSDRMEMSGRVTIEEGSYKEPLTLQGGLLQYIRSGQDVRAGTADEESLLSKLEFRINVNTAQPLLIDNNIAKANVSARLKLVGDYIRPGMTGRINIDEGGQLMLNERTYSVERGVITFTNEQRIEPSLDILAQTQVKDYAVSVQISGGGSEKITTTLTSDPPAPESDILAMLLTGRTLEEVRGHESEVAKDQVLSYLAGSASASLTSQLQKVTGISEVRIEPQLIQDEANPTARLTIGEDITPKLRLIYSMNLTDSRDQIYIARYDITRRFVTQLTRQSDNSYRMELRQDLRLGGRRRRTSAANERIQRLIGKVHFLGEDYFGESKLRDQFKVKPDQKYDFFKIRNGLDRLEKMYSNAGLLESRVRLEKETQPKAVDLTVNITEGPKVQFVYEGWSVPGSVQDAVRNAWRDGAFDEQRVEDSKRQILGALLKDGHLDATVEATVSIPGKGQRRVLFDIHPGERFAKVDLAFDGAKGISADTLKEELKRAKLMTALYVEPRKVTDALEAYYRQRGYLAASVSDPRIEKNTPMHAARVVVRIKEGPLFHVGRVEFSGNHAISSNTLSSEIPLQSGGVYFPKLREDAVGKLRDLYGEEGYNRADITSSLDLQAAEGKVDVKFAVTENKQEVIDDIVVRGNRYTSANLVLTQLHLAKGDPVVLSKIGAARRHLYNTGAFALVDVERVPVPGAAGANQQPVRLTVRVQEIQPWNIRYGGYYDTDRGPGGIVDVSNRNMLRSARVLGTRYRHDADLHELRPYFSQPLLRRFPLQTTASGYLRKEIMPGFTTDRQGFLLQQQARPAKHYVIDYGYNIEKAHTYEQNPDSLFPLDATLRFASLITSLTRETRDNLLDATRGSMVSQSFEWGPAVLGSQIRFVRYFGQYFKFIPLSKPAPVPFSAMERSRVVFAGGARVGFAGGLGGDEYPIAKRFFAGGGTTIRGFDLNSIGPRDALGNPEGGDSMIVLNGELRFPIFKMFDGVGFVDAGNVYRLASDFDLTNMRKSAGFGLRVRTPYVLIRVDYGVKLDRRPGEGFGKLFFSIGQAF
jgi:outer membrane protein assembly complex protein YaeT